MSLPATATRPKDTINSDSRDSIDVANLHMKDAAIHGEFTVRGWSCVKCGAIYSDNSTGERAARYCCATWRACGACGGNCHKHYVKCDDCMERQKHWEWFAKPFAKWDGEFPVGEWVSDKYYWDAGELIDAIWECVQESREGGEVEVSDVVAFCESRKLCTCKPTKRREFDVLDFVADDLPDDEYGGGSGIDEKKCDELNQLVNAWIERNTPKTYCMDGGKIDPVRVVSVLGVEIIANALGGKDKVDSKCDD